MSYIINTLEEFSRSYTCKGFNNWHEIIILMDIIIIDNSMKQIVLPHPRKSKDWQSAAAVFLFLFSSSFVMYVFAFKAKLHILDICKHSKNTSLCHNISFCGWSHLPSCYFLFVGKFGCLLLSWLWLVTVIHQRSTRSLNIYVCY